MNVAHILASVGALEKHEPEWERGFLNHIFVVALQTPGVATNEAMPQALVLLPAQLRKQQYDAPDNVHALILQLVQLAEKDLRFLQNFLDGKRCAPLF